MKIKLVHFSLIALVAFIFTSSPLFAQQQPINIDQKISEANEAYQNAYFELSLDLLNALNLNDASDDQLIKIHYLKGTILMALGEQSQAEQNFQKILGINPNYELKGQASPKIKKFFATEKERINKILSFTLRDRVAVLQDSGTFFELTTNISNLLVELHILLPGDNGLTEDISFTMSPNSNGYIVEVPVSYSPVLAQQKTLSYYLTITTKSGAILKVGSILSPKSITIIVPGLYTLNPQTAESDPLNTPVAPTNTKKKLAIGLGVGIGSAVVLGAIITGVVIANKKQTKNSNTTSIEVSWIFE